MWYKQDKRITLLEADSNYTHKEVTRIDEGVNTKFAVIDKKLDSLLTEVSKMKGGA
jgi:hypothetical protein